MRFTVKAKLASAFGVVLLLSMAAGGVAYLKLTEMIDDCRQPGRRAPTGWSGR